MIRHITLTMILIPETEEQHKTRRNDHFLQFYIFLKYSGIKIKLKWDLKKRWIMVVVVDLGQTRIWMLANLDIPSKNTKLVRVNANWLCLKTPWDSIFVWDLRPKSSIMFSKKLIIWKLFHRVQVISQLSSIQIDMRYHRLRKKYLENERIIISPSLKVQTHPTFQPGLVRSPSTSLSKLKL